MQNNTGLVANYEQWFVQQCLLHHPDQCTGRAQYTTYSPKLSGELNRQVLSKTNDLRLEVRALFRILVGKAGFAEELERALHDRFFGNAESYQSQSALLYEFLQHKPQVVENEDPRFLACLDLQELQSLFLQDELVSLAGGKQVFAGESSSFSVRDIYERHFEDAMSCPTCGQAWTIREMQKSRADEPAYTEYLCTNKSCSRSAHTK